jgi:hypothetical protein
MLKSWITPGGEYALREKRAPRGEIQRVRVIEHVRGNKWKAEWIQPNAGLLQYVESGQLIATWHDLRAFLKEEDSQIKLKEQSEGDGYRMESLVDRAMYVVYESAGDELSYYNGTLSETQEAIARVKVRAQVDEGRHSPLPYVNRHGKLHIPFGDTVELARAFCAAEPATVLA